ncbi:hypothetical protein FRB94_012015 [Tulasnella sp. JGI-2019a]|nr:hypothetical protein FRB94_012015 [Tulasnella sp. JGI-2019a]
MSSNSSLARLPMPNRVLGRHTSPYSTSLEIPSIPFPSKSEKGDVNDPESTSVSQKDVTTSTPAGLTVGAERTFNRVDEVSLMMPVPQESSSSSSQLQKFNQSDPFGPPHHKIQSKIPLLETTTYYASLSARQLYRHLLLRLPNLYHLRVWRIMSEALSHPELDDLMERQQFGTNFRISVVRMPLVMPPDLVAFKNEWEGFINYLLEEWKTVNIVSALLLSAILTMFAINDTVQPVTRTAALASLVSGLFSIIYGSVHVVRFQTMRSITKARQWAEESNTTGILWNVWIFLSLPAIALAYAIIFFCIAVMSYVWTAGSDVHPQPIREELAWIPRMVITLLVVVGIGYFYLVVVTFQSYSDRWITGDTPLPSTHVSDTAGQGRSGAMPEYELVDGLYEAVKPGGPWDDAIEAAEPEDPLGGRNHMAEPSQNSRLEKEQLSAAKEHGDPNFLHPKSKRFESRPVSPSAQSQSKASGVSSRPGSPAPPQKSGVFSRPGSPDPPSQRIRSVSAPGKMKQLSTNLGGIITSVD